MSGVLGQNDGRMYSTSGGLVSSVTYSRSSHGSWRQVKYV